MGTRFAASMARPSVERQTCLAWLLSLAVVLTCAAGDAKARPEADVSIDVERGRDAVVVRASAMLRADVPTAWNVLTDYDRYARFIPGMRSSQVVARRGDSVTVEQSADAVWLWPVPIHVTYEIVERPRAQLRSHATAGPLRAFESTYALAARDHGVRLDYTGYLVPRSTLLAGAERFAFEQCVIRQFRALADEIERAATEHAGRTAIDSQ